MNPKIFLAATSHIKSPIVPYFKPHYILESFLDVKNKTNKTKEYVEWCLSADMFLLDSGAFAFMNKARKTQPVTDDDISQYVESYIDFINTYDIQYFFELDIDIVYGYDRVLEIRKYLEKSTGKQCIPVWHKNRGIDEFHKMCQEYKYVAIGGIASKELSAKKDFDLIVHLCDIAHNYGCKVHGLGYLPLEQLNNGTCPFDTVDGTGWQGHMRAVKFMINDNKIVKVKDDELTNKERTWKENEHEGFEVWTKFSNIVESNNKYE